MDMNDMVKTPETASNPVVDEPVFTRGDIDDMIASARTVIYRSVHKMRKKTAPTDKESLLVLAAFIRGAKSALDTMASYCGIPHPDTVDTAGGDEGDEHE